ncbi:ATP-binding protein [Undibacterium baiyunense]|uniref:ATP-binding protein n=1 Tax=Undibacterium baiyunense TaxID=2828731 RepID=A0A941DCX7_9BURK|nr:ATP-binding protein [Undibacterium baiyunense]MBR7745155.1 ATP-binding protein [Undibacterium baiyunense]
MGGFEELCCQLAALEDPAEASRFIRKGSGADQGLECYRTYREGHEVGWQAKYFINKFESIQVQDLDESLQRAMVAHPQLKKFIVCLPIDLQDNRSGKKLSQVQRYESWRDTSVKAALAQGRILEIELWSASSIAERLGRDTPAYSGRARYWFDTVRFSTAWFREKFEVPRRNLGERYSPESHVDLPIQQTLQALARNAELLKEPSIWAAEITYRLDGALRSLVRHDFTSLADKIKQFCEPLLDALTSSSVTLDAHVPMDIWLALSADGILSVSNALSEIQDKAESRDRISIRRELLDLYSSIDQVRHELASARWSLTNKRELLISGQAGIGKSHLVADFGAKQLEQARPFILVLTGTLADAEPWQQIREQLDLGLVSTSDFLGALDAAAEVAGCRSVIAIDALNEKYGIDLWETRLQGFIAQMQQFPRLALILTVRDTYLEYLPLKGLEHVIHHGFAGHAGAAAKAYLDIRGIARPSSPNLAREFENPLFLRTCCAYLDAENLKQLPKGLEGITAIFNFYLSAVVKKVERELKLIPQQKIARKALYEFLDACATHGDFGSLSFDAATELFERFLDSGGRMDQSLLSAFLSEGVLTQEIERYEGTNVELIRFTFERLSDNLRAERLIAQIDPADLEGSIRREPLSNYFGHFVSWRLAGVIEAFTVQFPEQFGYELFDMLPKDAINSQLLTDAFVNSLIWRAPKAFTQRTVDWVSKLCDLNGQSSYGLLLLVCTEPENQFNAEWLHHDLWQRPMPQRDAVWSIFLAEDDLSDGGAANTLIEWAWQADAGEVENQRLWLAAVALTWFLSTSNRAVRDRATKALVNLLSSNLGAAAALLDKFDQIDDPYISERLLAACYGAMMQGTDRCGCKAVASAVWMNYFAGGRKPPLNLLARDYALGTLLYTKAAGQLPPEIDIEACKAKFTSPWPFELVTDEDLKEYCMKGYGDSIFSSTEKDADFGNYTLRAWLHGITSLPRAHTGQTTKQLYEHWEASFEDKATSVQLNAYINLLRASLNYRQRLERSWYSDKGKEESARLWEDLMNANAALKEQLSPEMLAEYSRFAEQHQLEATRMNDDGINPPEFDHAIVRRWICARAHAIGWSEELFEAFDEGSHIFRERIGNHRVERIGKKYQRIALAEATARLTDNLAICSYSREGELKTFEYGPRGRDMKADIDPSLLVRRTQESGWSSTPVTWWTPTFPRLPSGDTDLLLAWVRVEGDLCNGPEEIDVVNTDGSKWLVVYSHRHWTVPGQNRRNHADAWSHITCLLTRTGNGVAMANDLLKNHRGDSSRFSGDAYLNTFLGEHGWRDTKSIRLSKDAFSGIAIPYTSIVESLTAESNTKDNSIDESFSLQLPSAAAMQLLGLQLRNGKKPEFVDSAGVLRWQDPSLHVRGPGAGIVSRDYFLEHVAKAGLEPVWILAGEKNVYAGQDLGMGNGFGGRLHHTTVFIVDGGDLKQFGQKIDFLEPSTEQLKALRKNQ